jgi:hypothetical protein
MNHKRQGHQFSPLVFHLQILLSTLSPRRLDGKKARNNEAAKHHRLDVLVFHSRKHSVNLECLGVGENTNVPCTGHEV